ncbi:hypothetical protein E6P09_04295 [Haloferax mediterranei ATCC 33500]|uniref:HVO-0234-like beta-propeller domain-containing protein n=1 Tax=Haloferax mediterranei (strain ATCC 33500 / DSM 1411 / JCM 8866 / NBRC 14739 / NCIMB 2177 / R-4) TaxID=523841 RepID=I3R169_HALMT|nr:hypothetical protein [Haloferax mediterranei]AFK17979.2 hypothetical protein HFX_0238 [Haloferax mediterranei ATCC 33500]AHZ22600.1 hypothetical protein BM92_08060 [Haloferax mediterranei ATCC 33500]EMA02744.1 hypothetical protein C439_09185 [Haloferax mediterranei ATCC 33500]MDX5988072.1 hypothetical protein [Haloferax mediterranei ATCC 33500]QCQ74530.1 hypothetical protein E6P09_04295 [Haloferax mediterranei ATCC 33500]
MADFDLSIDEKRVYADKTGKKTVYVAASVGVVGVDVSDNLVGGFRIDHRCDPRDVAGSPGEVAVATADDVLLVQGDDYHELGFGPTTTVGFHRNRVVAADETGRIARFDESGWTDIGEVGEVRALDGSLVAAEDGVYRISDEGLTHVGLDDAHDVSDPAGRLGAAEGTPLAATEFGLYTLGNGWMDAIDGRMTAVASMPDGRAHAVGPDGIVSREGEVWVSDPIPMDETVVALAHDARAVYAVTDVGTFCVRTTASDWRTQVLGLDAVGVAVR